MGTRIRLAGALTAAAALALTLTGTASAATAGAPTAEAAKPALASAARSTTVKLNNWTGCTLTRENWWLSHGIWTYEPPVHIYDGQQGSWASESNGFATGTEGYARFYADNCANPLLNSRIIQVHWNNPYVGSNSYDSSGTDLKFYVPQPAGGSGNNATAEFSAWGR
ncbi:aegerolysin family protein [Kitasatospora sp. NPDC059646]|uniref:aegerolysin family protein n=1 Tax=Kitasatospora sp. NPDC059646 TaxID=3346893 RepID=UPI0036A60263